MYMPSAYKETAQMMLNNALLPIVQPLLCCFANIIDNAGLRLA